MKYTLNNGTLSAVAETHGGELISLKNGSGKEYIWSGDPNYWSGRNPHLFPIVGGLADGTIHVHGTPYTMNRHGFARNSEFSLAERGPDFVVFELHESNFTLQQFPFRFVLRIRHQLLENGFLTRFEVHNPGDTALPFCIGAHTAFNCPMNEGEQFSDYRLVFDQTENAHAMVPIPGGLLSRESTEYILPNTDTLPLDYAVFDRVDTLIFEGLRSTGVKLVGPGGHGVHMEYAGFPMIAFWTTPGKQAPYICLEPWHGCAAFDNESGEFTGKRHCITLAPGQSRSLHYTVTLF